MTDAYEREQSLRRDIRIFRELFESRVKISNLNCERAALEKDQYPDHVPYCDGARDALKHLLVAFDQAFNTI